MSSLLDRRSSVFQQFLTEDDLGTQILVAEARPDISSFAFAVPPPGSHPRKRRVVRSAVAAGVSAASAEELPLDCIQDVEEDPREPPARISPEEAQATVDELWSVHVEHMAWQWFSAHQFSDHVSLASSTEIPSRCAPSYQREHRCGPAAMHSLLLVVIGS